MLRLFSTAHALFLVLSLSLGHGQTPQVPYEERSVIASGLHWQTGDVALGNGLAHAHIPDGWRFLDKGEADKVLVKLWRNPSDPQTLGMIFPAKLGPIDPKGWGIALSYDESGYVKDDDAEKIKYDDLLKQMQQELKDSNPERQKEGYGTAELIGWAAPPRYDRETNKLFWAKELRFDGGTNDTLNYNVRVLGRRGVLIMNAIAGMEQFPEIEQKMPQVLSMVEFDQGNRYADFKPGTDKVAEYGLAALVAGTALAAAAKFGLFKFLLIGLAAGWKYLLVAFVALGGAVKKYFGVVKKETPGMPPPPSNPS